MLSRQHIQLFNRLAMHRIIADHLGSAACVMSALFSRTTDVYAESLRIS